MLEPGSPPHALLSTFLHLGEKGATTPLPVTESFWADLVGGKFAHLGPGRLLSFYEFSEDWDSWEAHPAGEELVCLFAGALDFVLDLPEGEQVVELRDPATFLIVPRGVFHTARVRAPSSALFVTPGEGTQHRPVEHP